MIRWFEKKRSLSLFITLAIAVGIFAVSSRSFDSPVSGGGLIPILYHLAAFFFLAIFLFISFVGGRKIWIAPFCFVVAVLYGISDEIHQYFVPGRFMSFGDVFIDAVGISFALLIYSISLELRSIQ